MNEGDAATAVGNSRWNDKDRATLTRLHGEGLSWDEIGMVIRRTGKACRAEGRNLNLPHRARKGMGYRLWTDEDKAALTKMYLAGEDYPSMAAALERSMSTISSMCANLGLPRRPRDAARTRINISEESASGTPAKPWDKKECQTLLNLWLDAYSPAEIGAEMGRSTRAIYAKSSRLQLPRREGDHTLAWDPQHESRNWKPAIRDCLCCREPFFSTDFGNRMCKPCKDSDGDYALL